MAPHADIDTSQAFGSAGHRVQEREKFDLDRANVEMQDAEFPGPQVPGRGYFVTTIDRDEEMIRAYIRNQELADQQSKQLELEISVAQKSINHLNIPQTVFGGSQSNLQLCRKYWHAIFVHQRRAASTVVCPWAASNACFPVAAHSTRARSP